MIQALLIGDYKPAKAKDFTAEKICKMTNDQPIGYEFDVDLEYPKELHDYHNDYPLAAEKIAIQTEELSFHTKRIMKILETEHKPCEKLVPNLKDKKNYVIHYRTLKLYLELGLKLVRINKVVSFAQSPWLKKDIDESKVYR